MPTNYISSWETWKSLCEEWGQDPHETANFGIDEGGGNSIDFEYIGDYSKSEED